MEIIIRNQEELNNITTQYPNYEEITYVVCSSTQVSDLTPLANLINLQLLDCSNTQIAFIPNFANTNIFIDTDLSVTMMSSKFKELKEENTQLQVELNKLKEDFMELLYFPGGPEFEKAKERFVSEVTKWNKEIKN